MRQGDHFQLIKEMNRVMLILFVTDKGVFASTVAVDEDMISPYYGVDEFKVD